MARTLHLLGEIFVNCLPCLLCDFEANRFYPLYATDVSSIRAHTHAAPRQRLSADNIISTKVADEIPRLNSARRLADNNALASRIQRRMERPYYFRLCCSLTIIGVFQGEGFMQCLDQSSG